MSAYKKKLHVINKLHVYNTYMQKTETKMGQGRPVHLLLHSGNFTQVQIRKLFSTHKIVVIF